MKDYIKNCRGINEDTIYKIMPLLMDLRLASLYSLKGQEKESQRKLTFCTTRLYKTILGKYWQSNHNFIFICTHFLLWFQKRYRTLLRQYRFSIFVLDFLYCVVLYCVIYNSPRKLRIVYVNSCILFI